jgi:hypothetical protein
LIAVLAIGCKGSTEYKDTQATLDKLGQLQGQLADKDKYIQQLRDQNAALERNGIAGGSGSASGQGDDANTWTFEIDGDVLTLKAKPSGGGSPPLEDAASTALVNQFTDIVQKSKGAIEKCYELALKKSAGLQTRTVDLTVSASFNSKGDFKSVSFSPDLATGFQGCLRDVASKWTLGAAAAGRTFGAVVKLTPT